MTESRTTLLEGAGVTIAADEWGERDGHTVLLIHGGGQTRHSWKSAGARLSDAGLHVASIDLRGHGDSDWSPTGTYDLRDLRDDVVAVLDQLGSPATLVGASLGGLASLLVAAGRPDMVTSLVLVDIVTRLQPEGTSRIREFMTGYPDGFATLDEAADAVAAYLPHRPRPASSDGLRKNLRRRHGRWYWHWDPRLFGPGSGTDTLRYRDLLDDAARAVDAPTLLVQGAKSDVINDEGVEHFRGLLPHVEVVRLHEAAHTAAADDNDAFTVAVADFVLRAARDCPE